MSTNDTPPPEKPEKTATEAGSDNTFSPVDQMEATNRLSQESTMLLNTRNADLRSQNTSLPDGFPKLTLVDGEKQNAGTGANKNDSTAEKQDAGAGSNKNDSAEKRNEPKDNKNDSTQSSDNAGKNSATQGRGFAAFAALAAVAAVGAISRPGDATTAGSDGVRAPEAPSPEGFTAKLLDLDPNLPVNGIVDAKKAAELVDQFRSDKFRDRVSADQQLRAMGPDVVPVLRQQLEKEKNGLADPEVLHDTQSIIKAFEKHEMNQLLNKANDLVPQLKPLYAAGGVMMDSQGAVVEDGRALVKQGPMLEAGMPIQNQKLSPEKIENFEKLIDKLDKAADSTMLKDWVKDNSQAYAKGKMDKTGEDQYMRLAWLQKGAQDSRLFLGRALANDPSQHGKVTEMLGKALEKGLEPNDRVQMLAVKTGADKDANFMKLYQKHGGSIEALDRYRKN